VKFNAVRRALTKHLSDNWNRGEAIEYPNAAFTQPNNATWVRFAIAETATDRTTLTGRTDTGYTIYGLIEAQVFSPIDRGDGMAIEVAEALCSIFHEKDIVVEEGKQPLTTGTASIVFSGVIEKPWYQVNVSIPWQFFVT